MQRDVSVIVPTFQRAALLPRALDAIFAQTHAPAEVILVDDGSSDETPSLARGYGVRLRYQRLHETRGVSAARNHGIALSHGCWIAFCDSDDAWLPRKLERQLEALAAAPELRLCHTEELWIRNGRRVNQLQKHEKAGGDIFFRCLPRCVISPSSALLARSLLDDVGLFDTGLPACEDYDLWLRICARERVLFVDEPLIVKYGGHADQLSRYFYGIDRFRIRALHRLLVCEKLTTVQRRTTRAMLLRKLDIFLAGAEKRGRGPLARCGGDELGALRALREHWRQCL